MSKPCIGLTTYGRNEEARFTLPAIYIDTVRRAGGIPLLIPPGETAISQLLDCLDALILTGGGDIDPAIYAGEMHETIYSLDEERDTSELKFARAAIAQGVPTLGICRGMQVINVALGGSLITHVPDIVGETILHREPPRESIPHTVQVLPNSRLASVCGKTEFYIASWHHQALLKVASPLLVTAYAPDNIIEAVEMPSHPWLLAVQWHPELTAATDPVQQRLFEGLVRAALEFKLKK